MTSTHRINQSTLTLLPPTSVPRWCRPRARERGSNVGTVSVCTGSPHANTTPGSCQPRHQELRASPSRRSPKKLHLLHARLFATFTFQWRQLLCKAEVGWRSTRSISNLDNQKIYIYKATACYNVVQQYLSFYNDKNSIHEVSQSVHVGLAYTDLSQFIIHLHEQDGQKHNHHHHSEWPGMCVMIHLVLFRGQSSCCCFCGCGCRGCRRTRIVRRR